MAIGTACFLVGLLYYVVARTPIGRKVLLERRRPWRARAARFSVTVTPVVLMAGGLLAIALGAFFEIRR
jgi:hypothetical protein